MFLIGRLFIRTLLERRQLQSGDANAGSLVLKGHGCNEAKCGLQSAVAVALFMMITGESTAADRLRGRAIAQRCSECHVVTPGQVRGSDTVPTFAEIGGSERFDERSLSAFLATPHHSRMPKLSLTRTEIADLVAYIRAK
jgi:mono/diheme cytochrome c family protein